MDKRINKTQLSPNQIFERHVFHRDQFAHYLRWSFIVRHVKIGDRILDIGCGSANLAEVLYRNRIKVNYYKGIDVRKITLNKNKEKKFNFEADFEYCDVRYDKLPDNWFNKICCFEIVEHFHKDHIDAFFINLQKIMKRDDCVLYLSTPNYNGAQARNHINEYTFQNLKILLEKYFVIENVYGTFASKKDLMEVMNGIDKEIYKTLEEYYDSNIMSVIFAPLYPEHSRNCLWVLKNLASK